MTGRVRYAGQEKVAAVVPDPKCSMNKGNHSPRGGTQGRNLVYSEPGAAAPDSTRERITVPYLRTARGWEPLNNREADAILIALVKAATGWEQAADGTVRFGTPSGLGVKLYEYQYLENTFAATTLFFQLIGTPNVAFHDRPSVVSNTNGFDDSGIDPHGYAYDDIWDSDVLFLAGNNPYESQSVFFMQYMAGKRIIVLDPRRTVTADYADKTGGLHLQPNVLGADTLILNALAKYIRDRQRDEPASWSSRLPAELIATTADLAAERAAAANPNPIDGPDKPRRARHRLSAEEYFAFLDQAHPADGRPLYSLERASTLSGIPVADLLRAAELLAGPAKDMPPPDWRKVSLIFEKGLIWGFNYPSTAAFANLGLLLGSVLRPPDGQTTGEGRSVLGVTGRAGGHQKGWAEVRYNLPGETENKRGYPFHNARDAFVDPGGGPGFRLHHYLDAHLVGTTVAPPHPQVSVPNAGDIRLLWVIGSNAVGQIGNAAAKWAEVQRRREIVPPPADKSEAITRLVARLQQGGLVVVQQDIYPNPTTAFADLVLPAAGWGEESFTRYTGERRLRIYSQFQDPPLARDEAGNHRKYHLDADGYQVEDPAGQPASLCRPDWHIFRQVMLALLPADPAKDVNGLKRPDVEWKNAQGRLDTAEVFRAVTERSNRKGFLKGVAGAAQAQGKTGHQILRERGTEGLVLPVEYEAASGKFLEHRRAMLEPQWKATNPKALYAFIRADWLAIEADFSALRPQPGEFALCNGRVNELWNSLFTHLRNETVRQRWPDNLPGTLLELHPDDARTIRRPDGTTGVRNGDVVEVACDSIHHGAATGRFRAVVSVQPNFLPRGLAFVVFSYPVNRRLADPNRFPYRDFATTGYVNNLTTGYVDPVNPIAAVKYARGTISATGETFCPLPGYLGPSYAPRNLAFPTKRVASEKDRVDWQMRELIVQKGLVRARLHGGVQFPAGLVPLFREPDRLLAVLEPIAQAFTLSLHNMTWGDLDNWSDPYLSFARRWAALHPPQVPPGQPVRFTAHIRPLFRNHDVAGMQGILDLTDYATVKQSAEEIYQCLTTTDPDARMPRDIPWPAPLLQLFRRWIDDGAQA
jgi:arsenite oxidase large subunit